MFIRELNADRALERAIKYLADAAICTVNLRDVHLKRCLLEHDIVCEGPAFLSLEKGEAYSASLDAPFGAIPNWQSFINSVKDSASNVALVDCSKQRWIGSKPFEDLYDALPNSGLIILWRFGANWNPGWANQIKRDVGDISDPSTQALARVLDARDLNH